MKTFRAISISAVTILLLFSLVSGAANPVQAEKNDTGANLLKNGDFEKTEKMMTGKTMKDQ